MVALLIGFSSATDHFMHVKRTDVGFSYFTKSRWLKITEKVSFKIASEASYVNILSKQKLIKMPKMVQFGDFLKPED